MKKMSLRNKKTGEVINAGDKFELLSFTENGMSILKKYEYKSLSKLCEDWEDYIPAEPLIKDEKIRKTVRVWADINNVDKKVEYNSYCSDGSCSFIYTYDDGAELLLDFRFLIDTLKAGKYYTIDELCGEEGEWSN